METGVALHTQICADGKVVNICNVHGMPIPGDKLDNHARISQSTEIINYYRKLGGIKIIGGDFNLMPETTSVKMFEKNRYRDLIKDFRIPTTRNRLAWDRYPNHVIKFSDYVFVQPAASVRKFTVPDMEISDHLPLFLELDETKIL